ncbi:sensor histidine kinase [Limimaricola pyoseonensis]|uniref:histidine kinase n=1 Tax=Limimaricola pyoseonensis TaxID=521013 RepID=A0A1G7EYW0_9RHOB|nr:sensor histidine kinase [Limimaricola pyoseonensis]SDE68838.1 Two-component sensor histidine kinase, contains HisKA and HATPase domains [Limimaricola pyoseonensis]
MPLRLTSNEVDAIVNFLDDGFCICEMLTDAEGRPIDYRFIETNRHFEDMTGLHGAKGRTALEMVPDLERFWIETYARAGLGREELRFQQGSEAMGRHFDVYTAPLEPMGRFAIKFRDITETRRAELARETALREAQQLLDELNHRVMNSLGTISAIIAMESRARSDGEGREALRRIQRRVQAVADLYKRINGSGSIDSVCSRDYLQAILDGLRDSVGRESVTLRGEIEPMRLSTRIAVPLGLVVNELVTNSLKYAFPPETRGKVTVSLSRDGDRLRLVVADDGQGLGAQKRSDSGIGNRLVAAFAEQLGARPETESGPDGTKVTLRCIA